MVRRDLDTGEVMVVSGFGPGSDWLRNIRANGRAHVSTGRESFAASFRVVPVDEAMAVLAEYERRNREYERRNRVAAAP